MSPFARKLLFAASAVCLSLVLGADPALAKTDASCQPVHRVAKKKATTHHRAKTTRSGKTQGSEIVRIAQRHLSNLGYYNGAIDGLMGPGTRAAIKKFQREHGLKADGVLGAKTRRALEDADLPNLRGKSLGAGGGVPQLLSLQDVHQDYQPSMGGGTRSIASRFARLDASESGAGSAKRYVVTLNGEQILAADGQPSVIGISSTYDLGNEDAVIFTTYSPSATNCIYRNHVLVMNNSGSKVLDVDDCTRGYQAEVNNGILFITFPEHDANRAIGATFRVEGMTINKM